MREYQRRVRLFQTSTSSDPEYQAAKLVQKLSGDAWAATECLDISSLRCENGVEKLLEHLWSELEPLQYLRTFNTLSHFYRNFKRQKGQEMTSYDTEFRAQCKRLDEIGGGISGTAKAYWFLEKAAISEELKRQVVSSAGGMYEYERLRSSLVAIVPQIKRQEEEQNSSASRWQGKGSYNRNNRPANKVNAVDQGGEEVAGEARGVAEDEKDVEEDPDQLELEAEVLLTHAARKRAEFSKK